MKVERTDKTDPLVFLSKLGLGVRATNVLLQMGLTSVEQSTALDEQTLLRRRNCGKKTAAVPALDRALKAVAGAAPTLAEEVEAQLFQSPLTKNGFCVEALAAAARELGREPCFTVEMLHGHRVVVPVNSGGFLTESIRSREALSAIGVWRR